VKGMMFYDYITSKDNEEYEDFFQNYLQQEKRYRERFENYINNTTLRYEALNKKQAVKVTNVYEEKGSL